MRRWMEVLTMRTIDADKLVDMLYDNEFAVLCPLDEVSGVVDACPTVDAVVVTRCKDCAHSTLPSELTQRYGKPGTLTYHNRYAPCNRRNVSGDDFCSYGEPKEGNHA